MPIQVTQLDNEPIIIADMSGHVTTADAKEVYAKTVEFFENEYPYVYRITDVTNATSNFVDLMAILKEVASLPGSSADRRVRKVIFVGTNVWGDMFRNAMAHGKFGNANIPFFVDLDEAIEFAKEVVRLNHERDLQEIEVSA